MIKEIFELQNPWRSKGVFPFWLKNRQILIPILHNLDNRKMLGITGSRQVGKSSLLYLVIDHLLQQGVDAEDIFYFNLDDRKLHELFTDISTFVRFIAPGRSKKYLFIDEVQRLENPGLFLKALHDLGMNIKVFYSGSSQLEIKSKLREFLVGRARQFEIQRLSFSEYLHFSHPITREQALAEMLLHGSYPAVALATDETEKQLEIKDIYQTYLEKDIIDFLKIDHVEGFNHLLILLANQIGGLLNIEGLARTLKISRNDVEKYITVLEGTFIIRRIRPFFKNYKKEITKTPKIYFMDLGLRNFAINNFNPLGMRNDTGSLFENLCLLEMLSSDPHGLNSIRFWRTTNQTEIDYILGRGNQRHAVEIKWHSSPEPRSFKTIRRYYPEMRTSVMSKEDFLSGNAPFASVMEALNIPQL